MDTVLYQELHRIAIAMEDIAKRLIVLEKIEARLSEVFNVLDAINTP